MNVVETPEATEKKKPTYEELVAALKAVLQSTTTNRPSLTATRLTKARTSAARFLVGRIRRART